VVEGQPRHSFKQYQAKHCVGIIEQLDRSNSQRVDASGLQPRITDSVACRLDANRMCFSVYFDRKARIAAKKSRTYGPVGCCRRNFRPWGRCRSSRQRITSGKVILRRSVCAFRVAVGCAL